MLLKGRALGFERAPHDDATLVAALQRCAVTQVPARFYLGLQLAIPAAIELWSLGWRRGAIAMLGVGAFGVWALFKQAIEQASAADMGNPAPSVWLRAATRVSAIVAGVAAAGLIGELVLRFLGVVFRCPGCAG